jgi:hypothetical protein
MLVGAQYAAIQRSSMLIPTEVARDSGMISPAIPI